jgi:hypothetical protein
MKWQKEHADIVSRDKANTDRRTGGLWRGFFNPRPRPRRAFRDAEDGVDRCLYCQWELEDGMCQRCGLPFDENGTGTWDFSDMDETSEHDLASEHDLDIEIDMDDQEDDFMDGDGSIFDDWYDQYGREQPYAIRRFLQLGAGLPPQYHQNVRPRAAHSAAHSAGSRRRSYTASIASDMPDSEMAILEEEDEDEEDSSMNDFIVDDEMSGATPSSSSVSEASSHASQPRIMHGAPPSFSSLSETSSRASSARIMHPEEEDDDESTEDEGPIRNGRARLQRTQSQAPTATSSSQGRAAVQQPAFGRFGGQLRRLGVAETPSVTSTPSSSTIEEDDEDEDEGPIPPGRRRFRASQGQPEPSMTQPRQQQPEAPESPVARRLVSPELGEFPPNLGYAPLGRGSHNGEDDEGDEDDSDGGRTTVGWEPITISNDRMRNAGSLTPTADRPNPINRPLSRTGSATFPLGTRGIRRRSSVLSVTSGHYEDNDADDDVSDGDVDMNVPALRQQSSRIRLRSTTPRPSLAQVHQQQQQPQQQQQSQPFSDNFDIDSDDSDLSPLPQRRGQQIRRQEEYDPRISLLFSQHMTDLRDVDHRVTPSDIEQLRALARTPLTRPRSSIRNRVSNYGGVPAQGVVMSSPGPVSRSSQTIQNSPRVRNVIDTTSGAPPPPNARTAGERSVTASSRTAMNDFGARLPAPPNREVLNSSTVGPAVPSSPTANSRSFSQSPGSQASAAAPHPGHSIERPSRPPSATGRRGSAWGSFSAPQFASLGPGLNTVRTWQNRNPFWVNPATVRPRQSTQRLRDQSSTATLRPQGSRILRNQPSQINVRESNSSSPQMRPQASRIHLRSQPSSRRLQNQASSRALRAAEAALLAENSQLAAASASNARRYSGSPSDNNISDRATELVNRRAQELGNRNPFARRYWQSIAGGAASVGILSAQNQTHAPPIRANTMPATSSTSSNYSSTSNGPIQHQNTQNPTVGRRRSNRALTGSHNGSHTGTTNVTPSFVPASSLQNSTSYHTRTRSGQSNVSVSSHESGFSPTSRPLTTGGDFRRN